MKNIFHRLSIIRIVIAAFFAIVVPYYAHAATIALDKELQILSESDELTVNEATLDYNSTTGFYDTDSNKYVTIHNKDIVYKTLFWCWETPSTNSDYFNYEKCSPYSVGIIIPSERSVSTVTLKWYKQATDFNWLRLSYNVNGGTYGTEYNNLYTWPRFCTNQAACIMPDPTNVFVRSGYEFNGWDASALNGTLTGTGAIAAGSTLGMHYITGNKDVTIKATWKLTNKKANVTFDMNGSVSNPPKLLGDCTSVSCYTPYDAPTRYGYNFNGWKVSAGGAPASEETYGKYTDIKDFVDYDNIQLVLIAQWEPVAHNIEYACSEDEAAKHITKEVKFNESFTVISKEDSNKICPKANYEVVYWTYDDKIFNFGNTYTIDTLATGYTYKLIPGYKPKTYNINYDCGDGQVNETKQVTFGQSYITAGRICQKDGYVQTGWQTQYGQPYDLDTEYERYSFESDITFTAIYTPIQSYTITYDCGDGELVVTDDEKQTVNTLEKYTVKPKICDYPGFIHNGWKDSNGNTLNFYTEYEYTYDGNIKLTATYRNDPDVPCYITFTSQYDVINMPADMELQTGSTPTDPVQVPMLTSGFDKRFDGWSYYDSEHNMYFKYFDLNGNPVRSLDYDHCDGGMELQAQWVEKNNCSNKTIYEHSDGQTPVRDVYYSLVFSDTLEDYATDGEIYSDAQCENPISITESDMSNIIPENSTYNGVYGHYNVNTTTADIPCIQTDGTFANVEYCRKDTMVWYVKYTCNDGYENINGQCVRATTVFFNGNAGDGAAANGGAAYSEKIMYYGHLLPQISSSSIPTLAHYEFKGWYDGPDYTTSTQYYDDKETPVDNKRWDKTDANSTLYAGWKPVVYTVTYDCGKGVLNGKETETPTWQQAFTVAGPGRCSMHSHVLIGWDAMQEGTNDVLATYPVNTKISSWPYRANMKFVAKYATQTEITFNNNGGDGGEMGQPGVTSIATYGLTLPEISTNNPIREGYTFTGWYDKDSKKYYNTDATPAVDDWDKTDAKVTLYAGWAGDTYTVTYDCTQYASDYNPYDQVEATLGRSYTLAPSDRCLRTDYNLNQWVLTLENGTEVKFTPGTTVPEWTYIGDVTLVAEWTKTSVIYFDQNGGTGGQTEPVPVTFGGPTPEISISIPTKTGYNFKGYFYDDGGKRIYYYNGTNQVQRPTWDRKERTTYLYADWEAKTYKVTYDCGDGELYGDEIVEATYDSEFIIADANRCVLANHMMAGWEIMKSYNTEVLETYDPSSTISAWKYDTNMKLRAKYIAQTIINFNINDGTGAAPDTITATYGMKLPEITTPAPTRTGYTFMGWYDGTDYKNSTQYYTATGVAAKNTWNISTADCTLYAGWKEKTTDIIYTFNDLTNTINYSAVPGTTYVFPTFEILGFTNNNPYQTLTGWRLTWGNDYFEGKVGTQIPSDLLENVYDTTEDAKITATPLFDEIIGIELKFWYDENTPISNSNSCTDKSCVLQKFLGVHKTGHMFNGWAVRGEGKLSDVFPELTDLAEYINADTPKQIDVYADWMPESYKLTYSCGDEATGGSQTFNITFGESHTIPDVTVCKMNGKKPLGWIINGTSYNFPTQITWDIDVGDPDATFVITPKWDDFYSTTLVTYTMLGQSGTILPDTCNNYTCVLPQNMYTYEGHTFSGWQVNNQTFNVGHDIKNLINANTPSQLHIVAQWQPNEYTLTYSCGDDATGTPPAAQPVKYNALVTFANNKGTCTKDGWNFIGWEIDNHQEQTFTWAYTENKTAVARWTENTSFVVTLNPNGGTGGQTSVNVEYGNQLSRLDSIPTRPYYIFTGFYDSADKQYFDEYGDGGNVTWDKKQDDTLYAHWQPQEFDVTYNCGEGSNPPSPQSARYEEEFTPAENTCTRTGYTFAGWAVDGKYVPSSFKWTFTEPVTFTAQWTANGNYTVTLNPDNGDTRYYILNNVVYNQLMSNITNTPTRTGYTFDGYYYGNTQYFDKNGDCVKAYDIDKNVTMFAHWTPKEYAVRYQCGNDATSSTLPQLFVKYDQEYELLSGICNKEGYIFIGWKADNAGDILDAGIPFTWTYDKNTTFVAQYTQNVYKIDLEYDGNGADNNYTPSLQTCTSDAECLLLPADTFTRRGYRFTGWIVGLTSTGVPFNPQDDIKQYITSARDGKTISVRARWTAVPYNVTYNANGGVSTLPKTECTIESCTPVSVGNIGTYMTRPGYVFKHWTTDLKIENPANLSNGISQDTTLYAMWDACPIGYYKPDDVAADAQCLSCEKLSDPSTRTEYNATSNLASTSRTDCAATCTPFNLQGGRAIPVKDTVQYPEKCEYTAISDKGNPCNIVDNKCVEKSCGMGYELVNNECTLCPDDNAATYYQSNSCDIKACKPGYHVNPSDIRQCAEDVIECYDIPNATYATKTWNTQAYSYGKCTAVECDTDYHIEDSICAPDTRECDIENGTGWQEWLYKSKTWSECYAEQCNPGYESDGNGCVRCDNAYDEYGDLAASTYIKGCEIATCMYQGEKYILANNQCVLVCYNDQDNTGAMWWDSNTKKCRRECSPGYSHWDQ